MSFQTDRIYHGVAYYPELWPKEDVDKDIKIMKECGINVVRMAEFAWALLEPEKDHFNIGIFDDVIEKMGQNGILTVLGTPTATPPRWFTKENPDSLYVDRNMVKAHHGSREHVCFNSPEYRERSRIIVEEMAKHYGKNPYVIAWQTHNEYNCPPVNECVCDHCQNKWRKWLKNKYKDIGTLNRKWGTGVWSTHYNSFDDVIAPRPTPNGHSASMTTNYTKFVFDSVAEYNKMQVDILKKYVSVPITHNTNRVFHIDQESVFAPLDFVSFDDYSVQDNFEESVFAAELCRCLKKGVPFWEMETASSYSANLHGTSGYHQPGFVKAEAVNGFFAGSVGFSYWIYRQHKSGTEMPHAHLVTSWGAPSASCRNVKEVSGAIRELQPFLLSTKPSQASVAMIYSDRARAFGMTESLAGNHYQNDISSLYKSILKTGVYRDVVYEGSDFSGYKLIFAPYIMHISEQLRAKLVECAENGATVVIGPYSGWRTDDHTYYTENAFGAMEQYFGQPIQDIAFFQGQDAEYEYNGKRYPLISMGCVVEKGIGTIKGGYYDGKSLICEHTVGRGRVVFLGARLQQEQQDLFVQEAVQSVETPVHKCCYGIVGYKREGGGKKYCCFVNVSKGEKTLQMIHSMKNILTGNVADSFSMKVGDYVVLEGEK